MCDLNGPSFFGATVFESLFRSALTTGETVGVVTVETKTGTTVVAVGVLNSVNMSTRAATHGDLVLQGKNELCTTSFIQDSARIWNNAPNDIKDCNSIYKAKKNI